MVPPAWAAATLLGCLLCPALVVQASAQQPPIKMMGRRLRLKTDDIDPPSWRDNELSSAERTDALLSDLTLNEKVSLLQVSQPAIKRVGLPPYNFGRECERGDTSGKLGTAYPTGLALGGTFDVQLVHAIAVATAIEVRGNVNTDNATFGASCFGPVSNLVRTVASDEMDFKLVLVVWCLTCLHPSNCVARYGIHAGDALKKWSLGKIHSLGGSCLVHSRGVCSIGTTGHPIRGW
jgi:hypothetical protein